MLSGRSEEPCWTAFLWVQIEHLVAFYCCSAELVFSLSFLQGCHWPEQNGWLQIVVALTSSSCRVSHSHKHRMCSAFPVTVHQEHLVAQDMVGDSRFMLSLCKPVNTVWRNMFWTSPGSYFNPDLDSCEANKIFCLKSNARMTKFFFFF